MNVCLFCGKPVKNKFCNVSCQNSYSNKFRAIKRYGEFKPLSVACKRCNDVFVVIEREKLFPQKKHYYCSLKCSNSNRKGKFNTEESKNKVRINLEIYRETVKNSNYINLNNDERIIYKENKYKIIYCKTCGKEIKCLKINTNKKFCSRSCTTIYYNNATDRCQRGGLNSSKHVIKRSKNEIYFYQLCKEKYINVLNNEPMFNNWDADIIILDYKIAILWNGKWHYEKIKEKHSLIQVQNRDKIKINAIKEMNYIAYIIKDMGRYNRKFVEEKFNELIIFIENM